MKVFPQPLFRHWQWLFRETASMSERCAEDLLMEGLIAECTGDALVVISNERKVIYVNSAASELLHLDPQDDLSGRSCRDILRMDICEENCPSALASSLGRPVNSYFVRRGGSEQMFCVTTSLLTNAAGLKLGFIHAIKDMEMVRILIAEKEQAQQKLQRSRLQMQAILDSIADGVYAVDGEGRIAHFSRTMERITGYATGEVLGRPCETVLHGSACGDGCPIRRSLAERAGVEGLRETIISRTGSVLPVSITTSLLMEGDSLNGIVCAVHDRTELEQLRRELDERCPFPDIVGKSKPMLRIYALIDNVCKTDVNLLIQGETGSGKEMIARAIHKRSSRHHGPFVTVNCAALSPFLLESEIFGHARGSFTGAVKDRKGKFEAADKGTLFLDEISEVNLETQVKLLRFLETKEFERVGETTSRKVDTRIIAATNRNLKELSVSGRFRKDLYYRISVVPVNVPALRERKEDIPYLVDHFIHKHLALNPGVEGISTAALNDLIEYSWPGNVRELESAVIYALSSSTEKRIGNKSLPPDIKASSRENRPSPHEVAEANIELSNIEKHRIIRALESNNWKVGLAARSLGYHRTTLWRRITNLRIKLPNRIR